MGYGAGWGLGGRNGHGLFVWLQTAGKQQGLHSFCRAGPDYL